MIVRKYTNYYHHKYRKTHPDNVSASDIKKANPLLKFSCKLTGRETFAQDLHDKILKASKKLLLDPTKKCDNEAAAFQMELKAEWDALSQEEQEDWNVKAEEDCGNIEKYL